PSAAHGWSRARRRGPGREPRPPCDDNAMATDRLARGGNLVVGGGYAGSIVARRLGECTIVNPENYMLFRPLLAGAGAGTVEASHVGGPPRQLCPKAELIVGNATRLDEESRTVF